MASLSSTASLDLRWSWQDGVGLSAVKNAASIRKVVSISDAAVCNAVWSDSRTIPASTVETLDLASLPCEVFGFEATLEFSRVHKIYIANAVTLEALAAEELTSAEIRVGVPEDLSVDRYAASVWQQSHIYLYSAQGWTPSDLLRIANVSSIPVPYHIALLGQGEVTDA
jgi:hypothetical protein